MGKKLKLKDVEVQVVSMVDKAANKKTFLLHKDANPNEATHEFSLNLLKSSDPHFVLGIVYEPFTGEFDADEHMMDAVEIEKAAHKFMKKYQELDLQHDLKTNVGELVQSYIAPCDMDIEGTPVVKGTWLIGIEPTEEVYEKVEKGEITGLSLYGYAKETVEVDENGQELSKEDKPKEETKPNKQTEQPKELEKSFKTIIENRKNNDVRSLLWDLFDAVDEAKYWSGLKGEELKSQILEDIEAFKSEVSQMSFVVKVKKEETEPENKTEQEPKPVKKSVSENAEPNVESLIKEAKQELINAHEIKVSELEAKVIELEKQLKETKLINEKLPSSSAQDLNKQVKHKAVVDFGLGKKVEIN